MIGENQYLLKSSGKIVQKVGTEYRTVALINEFFDSIEIVNNHLNIYYDSALDTLTYRPAPIINMVGIDDSGQLLTWTPSVGDNKDNLKIISGATGSTTYTISPTILDSDLIGATTYITFEGKRTGSYPTVLNDSGFKDIKENIKITFMYSDDLFCLHSSNTDQAIRFFDAGTPAIRYIKSINDLITLDGEITGIDFDTSGSYLYVAGNSGNNIKQYDLTTPFDITTAYDSNKVFNIYTTYQSDAPKDIEISNTGHRMFVIDGNRYVYQYDLDSDWQVNSAQFKSHYYQEPKFQLGSFVSSDGKHLFSFDNNYNISHFNLNDDFRISSADRTSSGSVINVPIFTQPKYTVRYYRSNNRTYRIYTYYYHFGYPQAMCFSKDGTHLYTLTGLAYDTGQIRHYTLSNPWDLSSASYTSMGYHQIGTPAPGPYVVDNTKKNGVWEIRISDDGTKFFLMSREEAKKIPRVLQYNLSTPYLVNTTFTYFNATSTKYLEEVPYEQTVPVYNSIGTIIGYQNINVGYNQYINSFDFDSDGSRFFIGNHQKIYEYTANDFNINASVYNSSYSNQYMNTTTMSIHNLNGNLLYIQDNGIIYQVQSDSNLDLGNTYNSYSDKMFYIGDKEYTPEAIALNASGTKMYITGTSSKKIHEYTLSEPYEIPSATFNTTYDTSTILSAPKSICFNGTESRMFVGNGNSIYQFNIAEPFDQSTYLGVTFNVTADISNISGMRWNSNGTQFIIAGNSKTTIEQYETKNVYQVKPL